MQIESLKQVIIYHIYAIVDLRLLDTVLVGDNFSYKTLNDFQILHTSATLNIYLAI